MTPPETPMSDGAMEYIIDCLCMGHEDESDFLIGADNLRMSYKSLLADNKKLRERVAELENPIISDGFGSEWSQLCPECDMLTMQVVRPGKVQCAICG